MLGVICQNISIVITSCVVDYSFDQQPLAHAHTLLMVRQKSSLIRLEVLLDLKLLPNRGLLSGFYKS